MIAPALAAHARRVLTHELERRQGLLGALAPSSRAAVERIAERTVAAVTAAMLEQAEQEPAVAAALVSIYKPPSPSTLAPASARAD